MTLVFLYLLFTVFSKIDLEINCTNSLHVDSFSYELVLKNSTLKVLNLLFMVKTCVWVTSFGNMISDVKMHLG